MRIWTTALLILVSLLSFSGCSSSGLDGNMVIAPGADTPASDVRSASALDWSSPVVVDSADPAARGGSSLAMVDGNPAVAYQYWSNDGQTAGYTLYYARANDSTGTSWGTPIEVTFWPLSSQYTNNCSLCVVNGKPAIAYRALPNGLGNSNLYYVRAKDAAGNNWGTPDTVEPNPPGIEYVEAAKATMLVINGKPAIWYKDHGDFKYIRAEDKDGRNWGDPQILCSPNNTTWSWGFAVVNGRPAVAWGLNQELTFLRANDANGDSWGSPLTVLADGDGFWRNRMAIVDGFPAIAFSGGKNADSYVRFIRALDADGNTWPAAPVVVTTGGDGIGEAMEQFAVIDGIPSISFVGGIGDPSGSFPGFVQALDAVGSAWEAPESLENLGVTSGYDLTALASGAGISFASDLNSVEYSCSVPAPPDPAVTVQLSTDKSSYIIGNDTEAVLTAVVTDEYGDPISGLDAGAFMTTLDGGGVSVGFSEGSTPGTYTGNLDISALVEGSYAVETTVTDSRAIAGSGSATFSMSTSGGGGTMHVGDLDASITNGPQNRWRVVFTVMVGDSSHSPVGGTDVAFTVGGDYSGSGQLTTGGDGTASYQTGWIKGSGSVTFTVDGMTHASLSYSPGDNHDPDGDSNGTSITVSGP